MAVSDRRSGIERRGTTRYNINIDVEWEGSNGRQKGTISDISAKGCFILCSGQVNDGETVKIFVPLADGIKAEFQGEVINHVLEIGFGAHFTGLSNAQSEILKSIIYSAGK